MSLRLLCDEHVGLQWYDSRLTKRFDAAHVLRIGQLGAGATDSEIWRYAVRNDYNVFTADKHFVDGTADPNDGTHPGVIRYNDNQSEDEIMDALKNIQRATSSQTIATNNSEFYVPGGWNSP